MAKIERKFLAHFLDEGKLNGGQTSSFTRLGKHLEEYNEDLNPDVETKKNIMGEQSVQHNGYEAKSEISPYYADSESALGTALMSIANERKNGDACKTTKVDVLFSVSGDTVTIVWAYQEDVVVVPSSLGGDTSGVQVPFQIYNDGNRTNVTSRVTISNGAMTLTLSDTGSARLSALTIGTLALTPAFNADTTSYAVATTNATDTVTAAAEASGATVAITLGSSTSVTNGNAATWSTGANTLTIVVTNGGTTKTYTVTVTKS